MEQERSIDRLARYIIIAAVIAIVAWLCHTFSNVLIYIIAAFVVSLIGRPLMQLLRKIRFKGKSAPDWLLSIVTIVVILGILLFVVTQVIPVVARIVRDASVLNSSSLEGNPLDRVNDWIVSLFPGLGPDFDVIGLRLMPDRRLRVCRDASQADRHRLLSVDRGVHDRHRRKRPVVMYARHRKRPHRRLEHDRHLPAGGAVAPRAPSEAARGISAGRPRTPCRASSTSLSKKGRNHETVRSASQMPR